MRHVTICEWSDLDESACGHCTGADKRYEEAMRGLCLPTSIPGTWKEAGFNGVCAAGCPRRIFEGDDIVKAELDGLTQGWCHVECTREPNGGLM